MFHFITIQKDINDVYISRNNFIVINNYTTNRKLKNMFDNKYDMLITVLHRGSYDPLKKSIIDLVNYGEFQYSHVTSTYSDSSKLDT